MKEMLIQQYSMEKKNNYVKDNLDECEHDSKETNNIENIITKLKHHTENCPNSSRIIEHYSDTYEQMVAPTGLQNTTRPSRTKIYF